MRIINILLLLSIILTSCSRIDESNEVKINFNEIDNKVVINQFDSTNTIKVAVVAMISPNETFSLYKQLIDYIGLKLNKKVQLIQKKTYAEVNNMIENGDLDFAFICSGAYVKLADKISLFVTQECQN